MLCGKIHSLQREIDPSRFFLSLAVVLTTVLVGPSDALADRLQANLVWEKTFNNNITDFAIGQKPDGRSYVPVVTTVGDTDSAVVHFFDEGMNPTAQIPLGEMSLTHITKDGQYVGTFEPQALASEEEGETKGRFTVYDGTGNQLWGVDSIWEPSTFFILGEGDRVACTYESWGSIVFYNSQGDTIAHWVPWRFSVDEVASPEDTIYGHDAALYADASANRGFVAVNGCAFIKSRNATVFLFDRDGRELWRTSLDEWSTDEICLSDDGGVMAAVAYTVDSLHPSDKAYIIGRTGKVLRTHDFAIPGTGWGPIGLSNDGRTFAYAPSAHTILCHNTGSGEALWQLMDPDTTASFTSLALSTGTNPWVLAAASTDSPGPKPNYHLPRYVYLIGETGQLLWKKDFSGEGYIGFAGPIVKFASHDCRQFFVASTKSLGYYVCQP